MIETAARALLTHMTEEEVTTTTAATPAQPEGDAADFVVRLQRMSDDRIPVLIADLVGLRRPARA